MKYRILECKQDENTWYEVHYRVLWMWFPVSGMIESTATPPMPRMFATKEQAEHYVDMRRPKKPHAKRLLPVQRTIVAEHDH